MGRFGSGNDKLECPKKNIFTSGAWYQKLALKGLVQDQPDFCGLLLALRSCILKSKENSMVKILFRTFELVVTPKVCSAHAVRV